MKVNPHLAQRLRFLTRVVLKECRHLASTDQRLFDSSFSLERARQLEIDPDLAERVEAFVGRFGRLQYTVGDKLLPGLLAALGEPSAAAIDNLDLAERHGFIESTEEWMTMRSLRNKMVHEYVEDPAVHRRCPAGGTRFRGVAHRHRTKNGYGNRTADIGMSENDRRVKPPRAGHLLSRLKPLPR
jgi:hypothetical protein